MRNLRKQGVRPGHVAAAAILWIPIAMACSFPVFTMDIEAPSATFGPPLLIVEPGEDGQASLTASLPRIVRNDAG
ncbi:MAG: hypothetical protein OXD30_01690 [Bryobacterales bacterium]|nr:hypothetical protein [Bryobacterales bacterium]